jgi:hypothetical protein
MKKHILLTALIFASIFGLQSCLYYVHDNFMISGTGAIVSEVFEANEFTGVVAQTVIDIDIIQGDEQEIMVEGHQNMMNFIELYVSGGNLYVDLKPGSYNNFKLKVYLTIPTLESVRVESTGDISIGAFKDLENLEITVRSTGDVISTGWLDISKELNLKTQSTGKVNLLIDVDDIYAEVNGTGSVNLEGNCINQTVELGSTGNYNAYDLESDYCDVRVNSVGDAKVSVNESLDAYISSVGNVFYKGNPKVNIYDRGVGDLIAVSN